MTEEWLTRRLHVVDERVEPDPAFATDLYAALVAELHPERTAGPRRSTRPRAGSRGKRRRWPGLLLVAAAVISGAALVGAAAGGFIERNQSTDATAPVAPHVCDLITPSELGLILGATMRLTVPESTVASSTSVSSSCAYEGDVGKTPRPDVVLTLTRYGSHDAAQAQIGPGIRDYRAVPALGDAAAFYLNPPFPQLLVLRHEDVLSISSVFNGAANTVDPAQMEEIARIILSRL